MNKNEVSAEQTGIPCIIEIPKGVRVEDNGPMRYSAAIKKAIASAEAGNCFAPFEPRALKALAVEYVKGPFAWSRVCSRLMAANEYIALNDLDRAMRTLVPTGAGEDPYANLSVIVGEAMAAAEAGDARVARDWELLTALSAFRARGTIHYLDVLRRFEQANKSITVDSLNNAIISMVLDMLTTPKSCGLTSLIDYEWDRPVNGSAERLVYWYPLEEVMPE